MLQFFRRFKERKIFGDSCVAMVKMQFIVSQIQPADRQHDYYVLGYIYGACRAILMNMGQDFDSAGYRMMESGYAAIFSSVDLGDRLLAQAESMLENADFMEAAELGAKEVAHSVKSGIIPFALGAYLTEEPTSEIRAKLRLVAQQW